MADSASSAGGPMESCCAVCNAQQDLALCPECKAVNYCSKAHQTTHRDQHKSACNFIKMARIESKREYDTILASPSTPPIGQWDSTDMTTTYLEHRYKLVEVLTLTSSREGFCEALDHLLDMLRLGRGDPKNLKLLIPFFMLRLNRDQECFDFLKWCEIDSKSDSDAPFLNIIGADVFESVDVFVKSRPPLGSVIAMMLLKVKMLIDLNNSKASAPDAQKFVPRSNILIQNPAIILSGNQDSKIETLSKQISRLIGLGKKAKPDFWTIIFDRIDIATKNHLHHRGPYNENIPYKQLMTFWLVAWSETPGAIEYVRVAAAPRSQFQVWQELTSAQYDPTQPASEYLTSVQKLIDELDQVGMSWTKESITGFFFQHGLPKPTPGPLNFRQTHEILDQRRQTPGSTFCPASQVKEIIKSEERRMKSPRFSLAALPDEVLINIIRILQDTKLTTAGTVAGRKFRLGDVVFRPDAKKALDPLAMVNRRFHDLCQPFRWRTVTLPFRSGGWHIDRDDFVELAMPRYGDRVQSLSICPALNCFVSLENYRAEPDIDRGEGLYPWEEESYDSAEYFNQDLDECINEDDTQISRTGLKSLFKYCSSLRALQIRSPEFPDLLGDCKLKSEIDDFVMFLVKLISKQTDLRHLRWNNSGFQRFSYTALTHLIKNLPLLQTISLSDMRVSIPTGLEDSQTLEWILPKSEHLSELRLSRINFLGNLQGLFSSTARLTTLELDCCTNFTSSTAYLLIQRFEPTLQRLKLFLASGVASRLDSTRDPESSKNTQQPYHLPALTTLHLSGQCQNLIMSFQECKNIKYFICTGPGDDHWDSVHHLISKDHWQHCGRLDFNLCNKRPDSSKSESMLNLVKLCSTKAIKCYMSKAYVNSDL